MEKPAPTPLDILKVKLLSEHAKVPYRASTSAAGYDIYSAENALIAPGQYKLIHTDISMEIPNNHYGQIKSRSGLSLKHGINVQAGTIDSDYRGEIGVILLNNSKEDFKVLRGDRIAQMVILELPPMTLQVVDELSSTD